MLTFQKQIDSAAELIMHGKAQPGLARKDASQITDLMLPLTLAV